MLLTTIGILGVALFLGTFLHAFIPIEEYNLAGMFQYAVVCVAAATSLVVVVLIVAFSVWALVTGLGQVFG